MWVRERLDNCHSISATKTGKDRDGWLEDAVYLSAVLRAVTAAPTMYEALKWISNHDNAFDAIVERARAALARAEGRSE